MSIHNQEVISLCQVKMEKEKKKNHENHISYNFFLFQKNIINNVLQVLLKKKNINNRAKLSDPR